MSNWLTIREASETFQVSRRLLHYMAAGRPADDTRNEKKPTLRFVKQVAYGKKTMYLLNFDELKTLFGEMK